MAFDISKKLKELLKKQLKLSCDEAEKVVSKLDELSRLRLLAGLRLIEGKEDPLFTLFFLEALIACKKTRKIKHLQELFKAHASKEEKLDLIKHFLFSEPFRFKTSRGRCRHVMFKDFEKDRDWIDKNIPPNSLYWEDGCGGVCFCMDWFEEHIQKLDDYLDVLISNLYLMRCAIVHESFPVIMLPDYSSLQESPSQTAYLVDIFPVGDKLNEFVAYETSMRPRRFFEIARNVAKRYLIS